ncbi:protector from prophage-induced early lysis [Enterobacteria phage RB5]|uniref:Protector from prophage-induced early lysis n=6 Tax=Tequatrovirus RB3 TaxID=1914203 RepID=A0A097J0Q8_BPR03|nr:RIIA lysis inhibitor [Escherichia phage RB3]AIT73010.1 protector from prophage-induced early lysis [Enterobacteria phage RB5]AIT73281.1 protector from prophage-induced early lysis [Enterobacteria phage RB6]AIT73552.1 protector from prophage-induced early lysis [Enterobacteria phage RB7]AIT73824.1 protector from prophage-induced early lysis [Enterobacteria phage RB9]AIT74096.1 protector from prophage-induced early lysis [Enterobacteria phage RB10]
MIITTEKETILGNGSKSKAFSITASPKVFKILSSDLYTNKIRAVVRELITNMIDAHALNGNPEKFIIQVPGRLDPRFVCRDFGPGMSDFDIQGDDNSPGLYNSYFSSSKAESNDFIGGFGLGSKSPFSYTDTFSITSYHKGEIRGYVAYMDGDGPQIKPTFVKEMGPDDKTGIEIVVPVEEKDFRNFAYEVSYIMRPFKDLAIINGLDREIDYFPDFDDYYGVNPERYWPDRGGLYAIYGGIVYPIDGVIRDRNWLSIRNEVNYIKFPMGSLDIAPSREALSLDDRTRKNIIERVKELSEKSFNEDVKRFKESTSPRHTYRELMKMGYSARDYMISNSVKFTTKNLSYKKMQSMFEPDSKLCNAGVVYEVNLDPRLKRIKQSHETSAVASSYRLFGINTTKINIVIDNIKNRVNIVRGLARALDDSEFNNTLNIHHNERLLFINPEVESQIDLLPDIMAMFESDEVNIHYLSEIEALVKSYIPKVVKSKAPRPKAATAFKFEIKDGRWEKEELFTLTSEADEITGYVAYMHRSDIFSMDGTTSLCHPSMNILIRMANLIGINEFYVIRPLLQKKVKELGQCQCIFEALRDLYVDAFDDVDYDKYVGYSSSAKRYIDKIIKYPELDFMMKYFSVDEVSEEYTRLANMVSSLQGVYFNGGKDTIGHDIWTVTNLFDVLSNNASKNSDKMVAEFTKKFRIVSDFIGYRNSLSDDEVSQIAKTMKALAA